MNRDIDVDPSDLDSKTIRFDGDELGVVTQFPDSTSRLVLKPIYDKYRPLGELVKERGGNVIDIEMPASEVRERIIELVDEQDQTNMDIPEPSGGNPYVIMGNTFHLMEVLSELELRWDDDRKVWYTHDPDKWEKAVDHLGATKTGGRKAEIPDSVDPETVPVPEQTVSTSERTDAWFRISTDGACLNNPGPGGWAAVIENDGEKAEITGKEPDTTNNRMELRAIIEALRKLPEGSDVLLRSDSKYAIGVASGEYDAEANLDLVEEARQLAELHDIEWTHVEGRSGDPENERADDLAQQQARFMDNFDTQEWTRPYLISGNTFPVRETLEAHGFEWNDAEKVWHTGNENDWTEAVANVGAERVGERRARLHW